MNAAQSIEKFHFIKESKLPSLSGLSVPSKVEEVEEKEEENIEDENIDNLSDNQELNEALVAELEDDDLMEE